MPGKGVYYIYFYHGSLSLLVCSLVSPSAVAALMEAFMNPELAVAAEALELMVQLSLDFIDDLVSQASPSMDRRFFLWLRIL